MNTDIQPLKFMVDGIRERYSYLSDIDLTTQIDVAARQTVDSIAGQDEQIDPAKLRDCLVAAVSDTELAAQVDKAITRAEPPAIGAELLSTAIERHVNEETDDPQSVRPDIDWERLAASFLEQLTRELELGDEPEYPNSEPESENATNLFRLGTRARNRGDFEAAEAYYGQSLDITREIDDRAGQAICLVGLGDIALQRGELQQAEKHHQESLDIAREIGDRSTEATSLSSLGTIALQGDDLETAETHLTESLDITRETDDRSTEANSLAGLGTIAERRQEYETAETYLTESRDIKRLIGDRAGEATSLASLGNVAESRAEYDTAKQRYTDALDIFKTNGQPREVVQTLQNLVFVEQKLDANQAAIDRCDDGLQLLAEIDRSGFDEAARWFQTTRAKLTGDPDEIESLYRTALSRLQEGDDPAAFELLGGLWDCRTAFEAGTEAHGLCLQAGVGFAGYHLLVDRDLVETSPESIADEIAPHRETLSEPATVIFDVITDNADGNPEINTEGVDQDDPSVAGRERLAYAELLRRLTGSHSPSELYATALVELIKGDRGPSQTVQLCLAAWSQRDTATGDDSQATLGAGLIAEAHRGLFEIEIPTDREAVFESITQNQTALSEPMVSLFEALNTGSTKASPDALREAADTDEPELLDIERLVAAYFIEQL